MVPPAAEPCRASAPRWRWRSCRRWRRRSFANAIALRDIATVSRAPGVGKKVAERIVTELRNKAPAFAGAASGTIGLKQELGEGVAPAPIADAVSALTNLGYSRDIAANASPQH